MQAVTILGAFRPTHWKLTWHFAIHYIVHNLSQWKTCYTYASSKVLCMTAWPEPGLSVHLVTVQNAMFPSVLGIFHCMQLLCHSASHKFCAHVAFLKNNLYLSTLTTMMKVMAQWSGLINVIQVWVPNLRCYQSLFWRNPRLLDSNLETWVWPECTCKCT